MDANDFWDQKEKDQYFKEQFRHLEEKMKQKTDSFYKNAHIVSDADLVNELLLRGLVDKDEFEKLLLDTRVKRLQAEKEKLEKEIATLIAKKIAG